MKILFTLLSLILMFPVFALPEAEPSVLIQTVSLQKQPIGEKITAYGSIMPAMGATENISFPRAGQDRPDESRLQHGTSGAVAQA